MRKWLMLAAVVAIAGTAFAQSKVNDQSPFRGALQGSAPVFMYDPDSTGRIGRANTYGHQLVSEGLKDRDHWEFKGTGFQGDSIPAGSWAKFGIVGGYGLSFADMKDYSTGTLMVSWTANSDSDSVAFEIFPVAKQSSSEDGYDYLLDVNDADSLMSGFYVYRGEWGDRLAVANSGRLSTRMYRSKFDAVQASLTEPGNTSALTYQMGQLSGYGTVIPLTDIAGSEVPIPIAGFWVLNRHPRRPIVGLNINIWAKVK